MDVESEEDGLPVGLLACPVKKDMMPDPCLAMLFLLSMEAPSTRRHEINKSDMRQTKDFMVILSV